jgi:hypothetical protein
MPRLESDEESRASENELQTKTIIAARGDGVRLRNAKEGKDKASSLAKRVWRRGRHWPAAYRMNG